MIFVTLLSDFVTKNFILLILVVGLILVVSKKTAIGARSARFIRIIALLALFLSIVDYLENYCSTLSYPTVWRKVFSWIGYTLRPLLVVLFIRTTISKKIALWFYSFVFINSAIYVTTFIPPLEKLAFTYNELNEFDRGPLGYSAHIVSFIYIIAFLILILGEYKDGDRSTAVGIGWCAASNIAAFLYETLNPTGFEILNTTILTSCCFYYLFLHTQITRAETMEKELLLSDQRAAMVVQEIRPRFVYDILLRVRNIIKTSPTRAEEVIYNLVAYLEYNLEMTDFIHPIPFEEEMDRVLVYLKIEQARLPGLHVVLQLEDKDFNIPALTVQHLVENSIQHGLEDQNEGTLVIKTFSSESGHSIIIQDNGRGFSSEESLTSDNQGSRFGIANVTDRLERMVAGDINIVTKPGVGTTVLISIPNDKDAIRALKMSDREKKKLERQEKKKVKVED